ncbi:hypothetical protein K402DRAFT_23822 [Aulographum hederae CBS 113979]|uniref:F-box domain-containing protein n=1 Tax=Aulographum hederae CBS 113979 TaxID=1176131 RepID=A0A6G1H643_9PEZI|nr:hypothetical protein K402DRAFT_23822 [Aulographum hederae CBS 113979]
MNSTLPCLTFLSVISSQSSTLCFCDLHYSYLVHHGIHHGNNKVTSFHKVHFHSLGRLFTRLHFSKPVLSRRVSHNTKNPQSSPSLSSTMFPNVLPTELVIEVVNQIPYSPTAFQHLHQVNRRLRSILTNYTKSISHDIQRNQFPLAVRQFPGLLDNGSTESSSESSTKAMPNFSGRGVHSRTGSYAYLSTIYGRYTLLDSLLLASNNLGGSCTCSNCRCSESRNLFGPGLLLLWRVVDYRSFKNCSDDSYSVYHARDSYIRSLPLSALAILIVTLSRACSIAVEQSPAFAAAKGDISSGSLLPGNDVEDEDWEWDVRMLMMEDSLLHYGPTWLVKLLEGDRDVISGLLDSICTLPQIEEFNSSTGRKSLISIVKNTFAEKAKCEFYDITGQVWDIVRDHGLLRKDEWIETPTGTDDGFDKSLEEVREARKDLQQLIHTEGWGYEEWLRG